MRIYEVTQTWPDEPTKDTCGEATLQDLSKLVGDLIISLVDVPDFVSIKLAYDTPYSIEIKFLYDL